jgi:hypothetical protein
MQSGPRRGLFTLIEPIVREIVTGAVAQTVRKVLGFLREPAEPVTTAAAPDPGVPKEYHNGPVVQIRPVPKGKCRLMLGDKILVVDTDDPEGARGVAAGCMGLPVSDDTWQFPENQDLEAPQESFASELDITELCETPADVA